MRSESRFGTDSLGELIHTPNAVLVAAAYPSRNDLVLKRPKDNESKFHIDIDQASAMANESIGCRE